MRIATILVAGAALLAAQQAVAGDYHYNRTLNCNECHVMHGSMQHGYNNDGGGYRTAIGGAAPYPTLLRNSINALCLSCHDNQTFAPDVLEVNGGPAPTLGRQGGALNQHNINPYRDAGGHTLGSTATAPGGTWTSGAGLTCIDCHSAHGVGGPHAANPFRNLSGPNSIVISYAVGTNDLTRDVFERLNGGYNHYDIGNIDFNEPKSDSSYYGAFCRQCHTTFHGSSADAAMKSENAWLRHPTADAQIDGDMLTWFRNRNYRVKVMSPTGDWGTQGSQWTTAPATITPSCFTCHRAHGNKRSFALILPDSLGNSPVGEEGSGTAYPGLCRSCHSEGV